MFPCVLFLIIVVPTLANGIEDENPFKAAMDLQNEYRQKHKVAVLTEDPKLAALAKEYATKLAQDPKCNIKHSAQTEYGESLYMYSKKPPKDISKAAVDAVTGWYVEVKDYDFKKPAFSDATSHFTQLVWKEAKAVGFGGAVNPETKCVVICAYYDPPGNWEFEFEQNVNPEK